MPNLLEFSPGVDLITDRVAVVMQDRPVVGASAWLVDAFAAAANEDRHLQLVTRASSRITYPVRSRMFAAQDARWVVTEPTGDGAYDGLSGVKLEWVGQRFAPVLDDDGQADLSPTFLANDPDARPNLHLNVRVRYQPLDTTTLGRAAELLFTELSGAAPAGWGTEEPVSQPWNVGSLTAFCRGRAPRPTWLALVGGSGDGTRMATGSIEVHLRKAGVEETVSIAVAEPMEPEAVQSVVEHLAETFDLVSVVAMTVPAGADTTVVPHFVGLPAPIGIGVGNDAVKALGLLDASDLEGTEARRVGPKSRPSLWYQVGDGTNQLDWNRYAALSRRLADAERAAATGQDG